jgi:membrane protein
MSKDTGIQVFSAPPSLFKRIVRVLSDAIRGFIEDDCYSKASALTFYSLLSIVPVFAVLFGIAKGFGFEHALEIELNERFMEQQEMMTKLIEFAYSWLASVQGGVIAGIGTITLLWSVLGLLNNIETALNAIWKTQISRSYGRKISDYLATMIIAPIFLVTSSSLNVFLNSHITQTAQSNVIVGAVSPVLLFLLKLFPFFLIWILFILVYLYMPNTKVYVRSAIIAGILAGTAFQIWQWIYIRFQIGAASYGAIYGSFAAIPLFMIWLQFSWMILLAGAEIAFEIENDLFIPARRVAPLSNKAAALLITYRCIESFVNNEGPETDRSLAHELGISLHHLQNILEVLQREHILSAITYQDKTIGYQPARAVDLITFKNVCYAMEKSQSLTASVEESQPLYLIQQYLNQTQELIADPTLNQPLYACLNRPKEKNLL